MSTPLIFSVSSYFLKDVVVRAITILSEKKRSRITKTETTSTERRRKRLGVQTQCTAGEGLGYLPLQPAPGHCSCRVKKHVSVASPPRRGPCN